MVGGRVSVGIMVEVVGLRGAQGSWVFFFLSFFFFFFLVVVLV